MIIKMPPFGAPDQLRDSLLAEAISFADLALRWAIWLLPNKQYFAGLGLGYFAIKMGFAAQAVVSAFRYAIEDIVSVFTKPKMVWIAAWWIITPVQYVDSGRNLTFGKRPSQSVGFPQLFSIPCQTISAAVFGQHPRPARIRSSGLVYLGPELFDGRRSDSRIAMMTKAAVMLITQAARLVFPGTSIYFANPHGDGFTLSGSGAQ